MRSIKASNFTEVGSVDVDAGLVWVGDPCYILKDEGEERPTTLGKDWGGFCSKISADEKNPVTTFAHEGGHGGMGLAIGTYYGDGSYPVYVEFGPNGQPRRVLIDFDPSD